MRCMARPSDSDRGYLHAALLSFALDGQRWTYHLPVTANGLPRQTAKRRWRRCWRQVRQAGGGNADGVDVGLRAAHQNLLALLPTLPYFAVLSAVVRLARIAALGL